MGRVHEAPLRVGPSVHTMVDEVRLVSAHAYERCGLVQRGRRATRRRHSLLRRHGTAAYDGIANIRQSSAAHGSIGCSPLTSILAFQGFPDTSAWHSF